MGAAGRLAAARRSRRGLGRAAGGRAAAGLVRGADVVRRVAGPAPPAAGWRTAMVAVPALLVVAAASSLITAQVVDGPSSSTTGTGAPAAGASAGKSTHHATTGVLTSQNGSLWVLRTSKGTTVSVDVGSGTSFGSKTDPSKASAFHTGATVKVIGTATGSTIDAKRVMLAPTTSSPSGSPSSSSSGTPG